MSDSIVLHGDSVLVLKDLPDNSVDAVVTDPPYGLSFMGKKWDYDVPSVELWREVLRVLKPGGHLLSFGGTRTYHRMVVNIEDAGFEIRDQIMWIYGSGFPKSLDVSKAIDEKRYKEWLYSRPDIVSEMRSISDPDEHTKYVDDLKRRFGFVRQVVGINPNHRRTETGDIHSTGTMVGEPHSGDGNITAPATPDAKLWRGWGTALKPANEPIVLARKPLEKGLSVAANVLKWGTGALNVDASRIETTEKLSQGASDLGYHGVSAPVKTQQHAQGRWPANVLFDEEAAAMLDEQSGVLKTGGAGSHGDEMSQGATTFGGTRKPRTTANSSGGASRFFYVAKASKRERNAGMDGIVAKEAAVKNDSGRGFNESDPYKKVLNQNNHPTVKPVKLMEYLCKLITPPNGLILDPFTGSGSTGVAATNLDYRFIGIEREAEYVEIANKRLKIS